jgi:AhpD family alkylhydroperoxidase
MKLHAIAALAVAATLHSAPFATAQDMPTPEQTYADIEATLGVLPTHLEAYPKSAIAGAWAMTKGLLMGEANELHPKVKALIGIAVAAQIPCQYCVWLETRTARSQGATDQEVAEAVAQAAYVRHWSTVLNGLQIDFATFKSEFGGD